MPSTTCSLSSDLPSPSHARTAFRSDEKTIPNTITTSSPRPFLHSQPFWLALYFCFNLGLTLYNKGVLIHFPYAYSLTAIHALFGTIGGVFLLQAGMYTPAKLSVTENLALAAFSVLYTINIAVSNLSLEMVTIPFHQVVRAATPIFTIFLSMLLFGTRSSRQKVASLIPVVAGVGFATYGDYYCTTTGLILTVLGTLLASVKTIYTSILQSSPSISNPSYQASLRRYFVPPRLQLHPLDLLTRMAPLAFVQCVILAHVSGELDRVRMWSVHEMTPWSLTVLSLNGAIAFGLNIVSFTANKKAGPLSMTVAANVKQVLSIILAVLIFDLSISFMNATGILLTLAGGAWYATVEYGEKKARGKI
ncbi:triose-phosphate transporter family-domain-containing protein [Scleroderma citrinum]